MGICGSKANILANSKGDEATYMTQFLEQQLLGEGQFGTVHLATEMNSDKLVAVKKLRKGVIFKDNILYSPMKPATLQQEIDLLTLLKGQHYCLEFLGAYESNKMIWLVTEFCSGGELVPYIVAQQELGMDQVRRITRQYLLALQHCAKHHVIHRDIKPENTMFVDVTPTADLRLIDFGCATRLDSDDEIKTTMAGTPFYTSPELFL